MHTDIYRIVLAVLCVQFCFPAAYPSDNGKYTDIINKAYRLPSENIVRIGDACVSKGDSGQAMVLYMIVCGRAGHDTSLAGLRQCASAHLKAGDIYYGRGDYARALEFYIRGLKVCEGDPGCDDIARFYKNIGNVYCQYRDYEKGAEFFRKGYCHVRLHPDISLERKLLINLSALNIYMGRVDEAKKYQRESMRIKNDADRLNFFMNSFNQGLITVHEGGYAGAIALFRRLSSYAVRSGLPPEYECFAYQELYKAFYKAGVSDSTLSYLYKCEHTAMRHGISHMFVETLRDASDIYESMGRHAEAMEYKARFLDMSDSIFNMSRFDAVKNAQFQYEMEKASKEIEALRLIHENNRQTITGQRTAMMLGIVVIAVVTALLVILYRQNRKLNSSYAGLYSLNRDFMTKQEYMSKLHACDVERIGKLEAEIARVRHECEEPACVRHEAKYQTSGLKDGQQKVLLEAITGVMENSEEFCSDDFSLDRLAALVNSNSKYVSQVINGTYHKNFSNYVNEYRIRTACRRLADTDRYGNFTVKAVGESVGYKSHATFVNIFRKITGLTPSLYQKMARSNV